MEWRILGAIITTQLRRAVANCIQSVEKSYLNVLGFERPKPTLYRAIPGNKKNLYTILLACCCSLTVFFSRAVHLARNYQRFRLLTPNLCLANVAVFVVAQSLVTAERLLMYQRSQSRCLVSHGEANRRKQAFVC
jgi:hypothetical protein